MRSPSSRVAEKAESPPCCKKVGQKRGPWTAEEDELLSNYIKREGEGRWRTLPKKAGLLRCGKSCRLRWMNYLRPSVKRGDISADEEDIILRLHRLLGNRWSLIAGRIPGRTDNEIKNYWNTHLSKKLMSQGIDPKTHKPFNSINHSCSVAVNNAIIDGFKLRDVDSKSHQYYADDHGGHKKDLRNSDHDQIMISNEDGDDDDENVDCCPDDSLSSFLNSLINDEMFNNQHQDDQQEQNHLGSA